KKHRGPTWYVPEVIASREQVKCRSCYPNQKSDGQPSQIEVSDAIRRGGWSVSVHGLVAGARLGGAALSLLLHGGRVSGASPPSGFHLNISRGSGIFQK